MNPLRLLNNCDVALFDVPLGQLNGLINCDYSQEPVTVKCRHCSTMITCARIVSPFVACEPCIERIKREMREQETAAYWHRICPAQFLSTRDDHPGFPRGKWAAIKKVDVNRSIFLFGPTGTGKTRCAFLRLRQAALLGQSVKILWPEQLEAFRGYTAEARYEQLAGFDVVLLDDPLITACRESKLADSLKHIIDVLMRHEKPFIITSQIGHEEFMSGNSYGDLKQADMERGAAIMRRIREACEVIRFP